MRKAVAWALYWMGDTVARLFRWEWGGYAYPLYNWLMCKSDAVQGSGPGPWIPPSEWVNDK